MEIEEEDNTNKFISYKALQDQLFCPICRESYDRSSRRPKKLDCCHIHCSFCLQHWHGECGLCRKPISRNKSLPDDLTILALLDATAKVENMTKFKICSACQKNPETTYCNHCGQNVCVSCADIHSNQLLEEFKIQIEYLKKSRIDVNVTFDLKRHQTDKSCEELTKTISDRYDCLILQIQQFKKSYIDEIEKHKNDQKQAFNNFENELKTCNLDAQLMNNEFQKIEKDIKNKTISANEIETHFNRISELQERFNKIDDNINATTKEIKYVYSDAARGDLLGILKYEEPLKTMPQKRLKIQRPFKSVVRDYGALLKTPQVEYKIQELNQLVIIQPILHSIHLIGINSEQNSVYVFNYERDNDRKQLTEIRKFGEKGENDGKFNKPMGIAYNPYGHNKSHIIISDHQNDRLQVFNQDYEFINKIGRSGTGNGCFRQPFGLYYDERNKLLYVCDMFNDRIQVFEFETENFEYRYKTQFGEKFTTLVQPKYLAFSENENVIFVSCDKFVSIFKKNINEYQFINKIEDENLSKPMGLTFVKNNDLMIADKEKNKLFLYNTTNIDSCKFIRSIENIKTTKIHGVYYSHNFGIFSITDSNSLMLYDSNI